MTEFYPLLVQAVSKLSVDGPQARQELYDHARKCLITQLSGQRPKASAPQIMREQIALEAAIRRVEVQSQTVQAWGPNGRELPLANSASVTRPSAVQPSVIVNHEWPDLHFDRMEGQCQNSDWSRVVSQSALSDRDAAPLPATRVIEHIPEISDHRPAKLKNGSKANFASRDLGDESDLKSRPTGQLKQQRNSKTSW